jgi:hypothetical protein
MLKDEDILGELGFTSKSALYFKDLGPQIGWSTVHKIFDFGKSLACLTVFFKLISKSDFHLIL